MKADHIDMTPHAVAVRLEKIRSLCQLMHYLAQFRPLVEAAENSRKR